MTPAFPLLLLLSFATTIFAVEKKKQAPEKDPTCDVGVKAGRFSEKSVFRLESTWTTDAGGTMKLDSLRGQPVVMALFFTNCEHSCPFIVKDMKGMQSGLSRKARAKTAFVLVSIDPERDSAEALKTFRAKYSLKGERWTLVEGSPASVRQLADAIGFVFSPGSKIQFAHSVMITVLNGAGEVAHQQVGIGVDRASALATIEKLASAKSQP